VSPQSADHKGAEEQSKVSKDRTNDYVLEKEVGEKRSKLTPNESNECESLESIVEDSASAVLVEMFTKLASANLVLLADTCTSSEL